MKTILLALSILVLVGCVKQERPQIIKQTDEVVLENSTGYKVRKACIDGVSYLTYSDTIIVQVTPNGQPMKCELPPKGGYHE